MHICSLDHADTLHQTQGLFGLTYTSASAVFNVDSKEKLCCSPFRKRSQYIDYKQFELMKLLSRKLKVRKIHLSDNVARTCS